MLGLATDSCRALGLRATKGLGFGGFGFWVTTGRVRVSLVLVK